MYLFTEPYITYYQTFKVKLENAFLLRRLASVIRSYIDIPEAPQEQKSD